MQEKSELESRIPENLYFGGGVGAVVGGFRGLCGAGDWFRLWRVGVLRREVSANLRGWKCHGGPAKGRMRCGGRRLLVFRKSPCQNTVLVHVCFWPPTGRSVFSERRQSLTTLVCRTMPFEHQLVSTAAMRSLSSFSCVWRFVASAAATGACAVPQAIACVGVKRAAASKRMHLPPR